MYYDKVVVVERPRTSYEEERDCTFEGLGEPVVSLSERRHKFHLFRLALGRKEKRRGSISFSMSVAPRCITLCICSG